jgi:hypothetical protein
MLYIFFEAGCCFLSFALRVKLGSRLHITWSIGGDYATFYRWAVTIRIRATQDLGFLHY